MCIKGKTTKNCEFMAKGVGRKMGIKDAVLIPTFLDLEAIFFNKKQRHSHL